MKPSPTRPSQLSSYAEVVLQALAGAGLGHKIDVALDSLPDLVASKMVALVERGAPRDFRDIYTLCQEKLVSGRECWRLWRERQQRSGSDPDPYRAKLAIETHLSRIAQHRPLDTIAEPEQRAAAASLRNWFSQEFFDGLLD
jgi:Nucleotidyl transferase AbiEii toxin, Type IV TA system